MTKNHHWRCGAMNSTTGKSCRNIVRLKGDRCYRHLDESIHPDAIMPSVTLMTQEMSDDVFENVVSYVQSLRDENEALKFEIKALRRMFSELTKVLGP